MFSANDRVYLTDPRSLDCGKIGTIEAVDFENPLASPYLFRVDGAPYAHYIEERFLSREPVPGYSEEKDRAHRQAGKAEVVQETPADAGTDFDRGFGIGGLARHPADEGLTELVATGQLVPREPAGVKMPHGQLWELCPICHQEPVCVDCGFCEKHCTC